ncbi:MAG TPA: Gmad2 immunoglobulin-like domain-containing protein [Acidimicrobiia bacterium]|nr:Gmad2 immunoglobulin-like domain-containing protein [Acidimicrobiia bacterium]
MSGIDDQRMKNLADRLVSMSPEPPPFPEEVTMTQPNGSKKQSPVLVFAGAAAIVLILAAIPIWLINRGGGEGVVATTTSTVPATETSQQAVTSTSQASTSTAPEETTTTAPVADTQGVIVFLIQPPENSNTGNPALVPFFASAEAAPSGDPGLDALRLLTADGLVPPSGFETAIPVPVEVLGVTRSEHMITVDMNQAFVDGAGGLLADYTMLNQLIFTAAGSEEITEVLFTVGGEPVTTFGSDGLDISQPLGRDSFLDQLNSVNVDSAATGTGNAPLVISGFANVFEATVSLELVDLDGNVVYEDFTTATCGTGCWGFFSFHIEGFDFESTPVTLRVFYHSPKDGAPSDVVSIPVAWGDQAVWDLTVP